MNIIFIGYLCANTFSTLITKKPKKVGPNQNAIKAGAIQDDIKKPSRFLNQTIDPSHFLKIATISSTRC